MSIGGGNEIGASCYFLNIEGEKILLDVGKRFSHNPYPDFEFLTQNGYMAELNELSAILISHAHFDHAGAIPRIFDQVSRIDRCNWVYTTSETKSLLRLTLEEVLSPEYGKNTTLKVNGMLEEIQGIDWGYNVDLEKCKVVFYPAGHILGASMILIQTPKGNILFTGDFNDREQETIPPYQLPDDLKVNILICESTYGYTSLEEESQRSLSVEGERFIDEISAVSRKQGIILIPAFSIGRSQEICLILNDLIEEGKIPKVPIYIDGRSVQASQIYDVSKFCKRKILNHNVHYVEHYAGKRQSPLDVIDKIHDSGTGGIIIASSGMLLEGSKSSQYAELLLSDERNMLLITGYQDEEYPGHKILELCKSSESSRKFSIHEGIIIDINASVFSYRLSAHADHNGILKLIERLSASNTLEQVIFVHGDFSRSSKSNVDIFREAKKRFGGNIKIERAERNNTEIKLWNVSQ